MAIRRKWFRPRLAAAAALLTLGCATAQRPAPGGAVTGTPSQTPPARYSIMRADVDFVTDMISHHAQAVVMASWAPERAASRAVKVLCARIINAQTDEIVIFQQWLKDQGQPVPEAKPMPTKMMMGGVEHEMMMPGMLTDAQMQELERSSGVEFDRNFLTFMIQHHQGAVTMVDQLFGSPGAAQDEMVFKFASDIYADQTTEIERMQLMLSTLP
jgi:uncharacterized protein (DUF305 family)